MGLSIHYSGQFNKNTSLSDLIIEVKDIAEILNWNYKIFQEEFSFEAPEDQSYDGQLYGISFTPPECETVSICFLSNYRMSSLVHLKFYGHSENRSDEDLLYLLFVKTQFAGIAIHKTIIEIFRYLCKKEYLINFELIDEGGYWETGDENLLENKFKEYGDLLDNFSLAVETFSVNQGESYEDYFSRIMKMIENKNKKK